jgi:hypothetical protein
MGLEDVARRARELSRARRAVAVLVLLAVVACVTAAAALRDEPGGGTASAAGHVHVHGLEHEQGAQQAVRSGGAQFASRRVGSPSEIGAWAPPVDIGIRAIHASLLRTGELLLVDFPSPTTHRSAVVWNPNTGHQTDVSPAGTRELACAGQSFLADGRLLIVGGNDPGGIPQAGVRLTDLFDPATGRLSAGPALNVARWYPTAIELGNGTIRAFGGTDEAGLATPTAEAYDPATNRWTRLPDSALRNYGLYPRLHLLPDGTVSWTNWQQSSIFHPATNTWTQSASMQFGDRGVKDNSVLLPGLTKVLELGGSLTGSDLPTNTAEIIDFANPTPRWRSTAPMHHPRIDSNSVLLPDGKVLVLGGSAQSLYDSPVLEPEVFDPQSETWTVMAPHQLPHTYHSSAVLLPDGRVVLAAHNIAPYTNFVEVYSPPYLYRGARPTISSAPAQAAYAAGFTISAPKARTIAKVVLLRPSSQTHAIDTDQRLVALSFSRSGRGKLAVQAPPNANHAPPGWYLLFLVSTTGVPSVASWIHIGPG